MYNGQWSDVFIETILMREGHGPGVITGTAEKTQTMATRVFSMDATMALIGDIRKMSRGEENLQMTHKEESPSRLVRNGDNCKSLRRTIDLHLTFAAKDITAGGFTAHIRRK